MSLTQPPCTSYLPAGILPQPPALVACASAIFMTSWHSSFVKRGVFVTWISTSPLFRSSWSRSGKYQFGMANLSVSGIVPVGSRPPLQASPSTLIHSAACSRSFNAASSSARPGESLQLDAAFSTTSPPRRRSALMAVCLRRAATATVSSTMPRIALAKWCSQASRFLVLLQSTAVGNMRIGAVTAMRLRCSRAEQSRAL